MFDRVRRTLLSSLRVPAEPTPPAGAPGSVRVFRAGRNYYKQKVVLWGIKQLFTLFGIVFSLTMLAAIRNEATSLRAERKTAAESAASAAQPGATTKIVPAAPAPTHGGRAAFHQVLRDPNNPLGRLVDHSPWWLFPVIGLLEVGGILLYLVQLPFTYMIVRLDFESRWYIVTDRSLRLRSGLLSMHEATMSFANIQQVTVSQDPLQRLLRIADVHVTSAGGGQGTQQIEKHKNAMHAAIFQGVDNAVEVRDLILERLRQFRETGLGDPDDHHDAEPTTTAISVPANGDALAAARVLLTEARALRHALAGEPRV